MGGEGFERIGEVGGVKERTGGRAVSLLLWWLLPVENVESEESLDVYAVVMSNSKAPPFIKVERRRLQ